MKTLAGPEADLARGESVISRLGESGITKLNFVGGEPLLHPRVKDFAMFAKRVGMTVSLVTNASLLSDRKIHELRPHVDWIGVSIDSCGEETEAELGRGKGNHVANAKRACASIVNAGLKLKVNTVVTRLNFSEDMRPLIAQLHPLRWKVFQMLVVEGQNDSYSEALMPTAREFEAFRHVNERLLLDSGLPPTFESGEEMINSYLMLGPDGSVISNSDHRYRYEPLEAALGKGLSEFVDGTAYLARGGKYEWSSERSLGHG